MPGWDWGGASNPNDREENNTSSNTSNNTSNDTPSPGDTGGEGGNNPTDNSNTQFDSGNNNTPYRDPIMDMVDPSKIPGTPEYSKIEKETYVTLPEKKLKMSKGVRPEMTVTLEEKAYWDRLDEQVDKVTGDLGYQLEKRLVNFAKSKIPIVGMFLPSYYPERTIAGDRIGDQDRPMDRPDQASDFKKVETKDDGIDFILSQIAMGNNNWADDPSWWSNLPESQANKYFQGMDQDNSVDKDYLSTHNAAVAKINGLLQDNNKYEISKNNGIFKDWLTGKGLI